MTPKFFAVVATICAIAASLWLSWPHDAANWGAVVVGLTAAPFFFYNWAWFVLNLQERYGVKDLFNQ